MSNKVRPCNGFRCMLCSQIQTGDRFLFNNGFVFNVEEEELSCKAKDVIYVLKCTTCQAEYIGETTNIRNRIHTHCSNVKTKQQFCRATDHFVSCGTHHSDIRSRFTFFLLEVEHDQHTRRAKEAYYIRLFKPQMNK